MPRAPRRSWSSAPPATRPRRTQWADALADQLDSGVLVSRDGDGHTGYNSGNECVDDAVESYLVAGIVPKDGLPPADQPIPPSIGRHDVSAPTPPIPSARYSRSVYSPPLPGRRRAARRLSSVGRAIHS